jgi:hypothetical protein
MTGSELLALAVAAVVGGGNVSKAGTVIEG